MAKRIGDFKILENRNITSDIFILELLANNYLPQIIPGQFVQVKVEGSPETFLRRPFSIHDVDYERNTIKLLIQVAGKGTEKLSLLKSEDTLNLIYPLGNSFSMPPENTKILLIGGGCGIAPLLFLGKYLRSKNYHPEVLLGFRNIKRLIEYDDYLNIGHVHLTTEDGSKGEKGFVTDHSVLNNSHFDQIYCCGPESMMRAVAAYCFLKDIACEVSLENLMACGFGICLCCVVDTVRGNVCSCLEGPVFNIKTLKW